jgi:hypothetical protein
MNIDVPDFGEDDDPQPITIEDATSKGADVLVDLGGVLYPGKVVHCRIANEVCVETTAARHMSRQWKVLLFHLESRKSVYGAATLVLPGIDSYNEKAIQKEYAKKTPDEQPAPLDEPEALSREDDQPEWEQPSQLEPDEEREMWFQRD